MVHMYSSHEVWTPLAVFEVPAAVAVVSVGTSCMCAGELGDAGKLLEEAAAA